MKYSITHRTVYSGSEAVSVCHNAAWLRPQELPYQHCEQFELQIDPQPSIRSERIDSFGNHVDQFSFNQGYETLTVTALSIIEVAPRQLDLEETPNWEDVRESCQTAQSADTLEAYGFVFESPRIRTTAEFREYAKASFTPRRPIGVATSELTERIHTDFKFDNRATTVTTPVEEVFRIRRGVCQDFAHMQIALLRSLQLPARYVSGYLRTIPPPGKPRLIGADASHAWLSVYCGSETAWVEFDPTNKTLAGTDHITVAFGRDYSDVPPLRGVFLGGGSHTLQVSVDVEPLMPTSTKSSPQ